MMSSGFSPRRITFRWTREMRMQAMRKTSTSP